MDTDDLKAAYLAGYLSAARSIWLACGGDAPNERKAARAWHRWRKRHVERTRCPYAVANHERSCSCGECVDGWREEVRP